MLLIYHAKNVIHTVYFRPGTKRSSQKGNRYWNIPAIRALLESIITKNILFLHAILGCDTTSGIYGMGKKLSSSKIKSTSQFQDQAKVFMSQGASKDDIITAGERALVCLYSGDPQHGISVPRYEQFCAKAATSTMPVQPGALPPTSASVKYHSLRVYHQIQERLGVELSSLDWGWKISGTGKLLPIMTDLQPAPQKILEAVHCGCKSGCGTMRCSWR